MAYKPVKENVEITDKMKEWLDKDICSMCWEGEQELFVGKRANGENVVTCERCMEDYELSWVGITCHDARTGEHSVFNVHQVDDDDDIEGEINLVLIWGN